MHKLIVLGTAVLFTNGALGETFKSFYSRYQNAIQKKDVTQIKKIIVGLSSLKGDQINRAVEFMATQSKELQSKGIQPIVKVRKNTATVACFLDDSSYQTHFVKRKKRWYGYDERTDSRLVVGLDLENIYKPLYQCKDWYCLNRVTDSLAGGKKFGETRVKEICNKIKRQNRESAELTLQEHCVKSFGLYMAKKGRNPTCSRSPKFDTNAISPYFWIDVIEKRISKRHLKMLQQSFISSESGGPTHSLININSNPRSFANIYQCSDPKGAYSVPYYFQYSIKGKSYQMLVQDKDLNLKSLGPLIQWLNQNRKRLKSFSKVEARLADINGDKKLDAIVWNEKELFVCLRSKKSCTELSIKTDADPKLAYFTVNKGAIEIHNRVNQGNLLSRYRIKGGKLRLVR